MFDSPINDWRPGQIKLIGWPWHGRVDIKENGDFLDPFLTLPSGRSLLLKFTPSALSGRRPQVGTMLLFKAKDAAAIQRTDEEKALDAKRGAEWRNSYLFNPRSHLVYNRSINFLSGTSWPWRKDGATYWVRLSGIGNAYLYDPITLKQLTEKSEELSFKYVDTSFPDGRPDDLVDSDNKSIGTFSLMDITRDGSKAIFARFSISTRPPDMPTTAVGDWNESPVEFWEAVPEYADGQFSLNFRLLRSRSQVLGKVTTSTPKSIVRGVSLTSEVKKIGSGSEEGKGRYQVTWSTETIDGEGMAESRDYINGAYVNEFEGRIIAIYYNDEGDYEQIEANGGYTSTISTSLSGDASGSAIFEGVDFGSDMYSPGYALTPIVDGSMTFSYSFTQTVNIRAHYQIINGDALDEGVIFESSSSWVVNGTSPYALTTNKANVQSSQDSGQGSINASLKVGGNTVWSGSSSGSGSTQGDHGFVHTPLPNTPMLGGSVFPSFAAPTTAIKVVNDAQAKETKINVAGFRYAATVPVAGVFVSQKTGSIEEKSLHVGSVAVPKPGAIFSGSHTYGLVNEIYGSYNPVTGELIRDSANPVFWI